MLMAKARAQGDPGTGLQGYHRGYGESAALQSARSVRPQR